MAGQESKLATFRIDSQKWERFKNWASSNNSSASAVLLNLIDRCLAGEISASSTTPNTNADNLDSLIDSRIEARLQSLEQPHPLNLDTILDSRDRQLESHLLSILVSMLEDKLNDLLEELQGKIHNIELALDERIEKLELSQKAAQPLQGNGDTGNCGQVEVEAMQQEKEQLLAKIEELQRENVSIVQRNFELQSENESLLQQNQELQSELNNLSTAPAISLPDLQLVRVRVLKSLTSGKGKIATTSPQYKTAARALDRFILELRESTPTSTPASSTPDGTAAPLVEEATKKLENKHYTKAEYYTDLRQIVESCGYRLFIDTNTLSRGKELFIVSPPGNSQEHIVSTQDIGEVVDWLSLQDVIGN